VDIFFDHFLASNWSEYSPVTLRQFAKQAHYVFLTNFFMLPMRVKQFLPFLIQHRRLESYSEKENLFQVLEIMSNRTSLPSNSAWAMEMLHQEYHQFESLFRSFFAELTSYVENEFLVSIPKPETLYVQ
jgi:acyl carrier protein phosphodiesterase